MKHTVEARAFEVLDLQGRTHLINIYLIFEITSTLYVHTRVYTAPSFQKLRRKIYEIWDDRTPRVKC